MDRPLTKAEAYAVRLLALGYTVVEIAAEEGVSPRAIHFRLRAAMQKMDAVTYPQLTALFREME